MVIAIVWLCGVLFFLFAHYMLTYRESYSQLIFSEDKTLMHATLAEDEQWRFSPQVAVPRKLEKAVLTFEDKRFYQHVGIDPLALSRAVFQNVSQMRKVSGASTLTMQLVRMGRREYSRSIGEKLLEMLIALRVEMKYTKDEILQLWASRAPFGSNVVGFEAASWRYFGRSPGNLSWAEASLLAVLPNSPALIFPGRNHQILIEKRNRLLKKLWKNKTIDRLTYELALDEPLPDDFYDMPRQLPHLSQHIEQLQGKQPGNRYTVSINPELQKPLKRLATGYQQRYARQNVRNLAIVVAETRSGRVLGYVGNAGNTETPGVQVDVAQSLRSTGSLLKPFLYAGMMTEGMITPDELIKDLPVNYAGYSPKNYNAGYFGAVPASEALSRSLNVPMVRLLKQFSVERFHRRLKEIGMHSLKEKPSHYGLSLILGGADATLFELTGMYAAMGRVLEDFPGLSGQYKTTHYHRLHLGNYKPQNHVYDEPPLTAGAIWYTLEAMRELTRPVAEGRWQQYTSSRRLAWKTGTSYGFRDAWAIGLDPQFTVGVWVGNASGEPRNGLVGVQKAGPVLFDVFRLLPKTEGWFPRPWDELEEVEICKHSGKIAGEACVHAQKAYLPIRAARSGVCNYCINVLVDKTRTARYYRQCANTEVVDTSWFVLPAGMEWFHKRISSRYSPLPPLSENCKQFKPKENPLAFIYPHAGARLVLPYGLSGEQNEIVFQAVHRFGNATIFWYLDNHFVTQTENYHKIGIKPEPGWHTLLIEDSQGMRKQLKFKILKKKSASRSIQKKLSSY